MIATEYLTPLKKNSYIGIDFEFVPIFYFLNYLFLHPSYSLLNS